MNRFGAEAPDRGVTEILGYILIFSLVTLTATGVFVVGSSHLEDTRDSERISNAEKAFEVLAGNIDDHVSQGVIGRATEIRVAEADLYVDDEDPEWIEVEIEDSGETVNSSDRLGNRTNAITYESTGGSKVVYSNGAVFSEQSGGSYMAEEPNMILTDERAVVPVTLIRGEDSVSAMQSTVVQVRTERNRADLVHRFESGESYEVTMTIGTTAPRAAAWERYLESFDPVSCTFEDPHETELSCEFETDEVYVPVTLLDIELN